MDRFIIWFIVIGLLIFLTEYWYIALAIIVIILIYKHTANETFKKNKYCNIDFDLMDGHEFEYFCADLLRDNGFTNVQVTPGSSDHGIDILARKKGTKYAIQCKCYSNKVGNKAIQEAYSGRTIYGANVAAVMTNNYFTKQAESDAKKLNVQLWDRNKIIYYIRNVNSINNKTEENIESNQLSVAVTPELSIEPKDMDTPIQMPNSLQITKEVPNIMYDKDNGIFPPGQYLVGDDIELGKYLLITKNGKVGSISIYQNYSDYKKDNMITYQSFDDDYHLSLRENGLFIVVENADIKKL